MCVLYLKLWNCGSVVVIVADCDRRDLEFFILLCGLLGDPEPIYTLTFSSLTTLQDCCENETVGGETTYTILYFLGNDSVKK